MRTSWPSRLSSHILSHWVRMSLHRSHLTSMRSALTFSSQFHDLVILAQRVSFWSDFFFLVFADVFHMTINQLMKSCFSHANLTNLTRKLQVHAPFIRHVPMEQWLQIATLSSGSVSTRAAHGLTTETESPDQTWGLESQMQTNKTNKPHLSHTLKLPKRHKTRFCPPKRFLRLIFFPTFFLFFHRGHDLLSHCGADQTIKTIPLWITNRTSRTNGLFVRTSWPSRLSSHVLLHWVRMSSHRSHLASMRSALTLSSQFHDLVVLARHRSGGVSVVRKHVFKWIQGLVADDFFNRCLLARFCAFVSVCWHFFPNLTTTMN
jgi:hypothetical protein